jgi:transglutaminase-like putative cysteine protease
MAIFQLIFVTFMLTLVCGCAASQHSLHSPNTKWTRSFEFLYSAVITPPEGAKEVRVWFPLPYSDGNQEVHLLEIKTPQTYKIYTEPSYGNKMAFFELSGDIPKQIPLELRFRATRYEDRKEIDLEFPHAKADQFLDPSRLGVVTPEVEGIAKQIRGTQRVPFDQAHGAYLYVLDSMEYKKEGEGWGRGDTTWACSAHYGNCTDYHALFIAIAQAMGIPAVFEIGFSLPHDKREGLIAGYHCWVHFYLQGKGWVPVDASEGDKNPAQREYFFGAHDANRIKFTTGRDLWLVPKQRGEPLNFFIYPYVEVDGRPCETMELEFSFKDI